MIETVCPLCGVPRPRDAKQCICNYTFEYDKLPADRRARAGGTGLVRGLIVAVAAIAAVAAGAWFNGNVAHADRSRPELGFFMIAAGIFSVCGGFFDWSFFMSHRKARFFALFLGRTGTRFFYGAIGGGLAGAGAALALL